MKSISLGVAQYEAPELSQISKDSVSNFFFCYVSLERNFFYTDSFEIFAYSGTSSCATPDEIDSIPGTYTYLTGIKINGISEGLKLAGCG